MPILRLMGNEVAKAAANTFQKQLAEWDGPKNAATLLEEEFA